MDGCVIPDGWMMQYLRKCTDVLTPAFYAHSCVATPTFFGGPRQALTCDSLDSAVGHLTVAYSFRPELCCQGTAHMASALERVKDEYAAMLLASGYPNYNEGRLKRLAEGMRILREASSGQHPSTTYAEFHEAQQSSWIWFIPLPRLRNTPLSNDC